MSLNGCDFKLELALVLRKRHVLKLKVCLGIVSCPDPTTRNSLHALSPNDIHVLRLRITGLT